MFATINLPGSSHFRSFGPANKAQCESWIKRTVAHMLETEQVPATLPRRIISNSEARKWKYRDGEYVFKHFREQY